MLSSESEFDLNLEVYSKEYEKFDVNKYKKYLELISKRKFDFENDNYPDLNEIFDLSKSAHLKYLEKKLIFNMKFDTDIFIEIYENYIKLGKDNKISLENNIKLSNDKFVLYKVDPRLLKLLLLGPRYAHWNNAEIGSHLKFFRKPNIFERQVYGSMNYFHN